MNGAIRKVFHANRMLAVFLTAVVALSLVLTGSVVLGRSRPEPGLRHQSFFEFNFSSDNPSIAKAVTPEKIAFQWPGPEGSFEIQMRNDDADPKSVAEYHELPDNASRLQIDVLMRATQGLGAVVSMVQYDEGSNIVTQKSEAIRFNSKLERQFPFSFSCMVDRRSRFFNMIIQIPDTDRAGFIELADLDVIYG